MAGVNLAEDGQSMTREFLNGRLCKRGNNLQPRSKGARVADVTGFLRDFVHRDVYSISNPITEESHVYYRRARFNWKLFIHREDGIEIELSRRGEIQSVRVTNSFPRKRILIFGKARSRSHRSCHCARSSSARSIDTGVGDGLHLRRMIRMVPSYGSRGRGTKRCTALIEPRVNPQLPAANKVGH